MLTVTDFAILGLIFYSGVLTFLVVRLFVRTRVLGEYNFNEIEGTTRRNEAQNDRCRFDIDKLTKDWHSYHESLGDKLNKDWNSYRESLGDLFAKKNTEIGKIKEKVTQLEMHSDTQRKLIEGFVTYLNVDVKHVEPKKATFEFVDRSEG